MPIGQRGGERDQERFRHLLGRLETGQRHPDDGEQHEQERRGQDGEAQRLQPAGATHRTVFLSESRLRSMVRNAITMTTRTTTSTMKAMALACASRKNWMPSRYM